MGIKIAQLDYDDLVVIHASLKMSLSITNHHLNDKEISKPIKEMGKDVLKRTKITYKKIDAIIKDMGTENVDEVLQNGI